MSLIFNYLYSTARGTTKCEEKRSEGISRARGKTKCGDKQSAGKSRARKSRARGKAKARAKKRGKLFKLVPLLIEQFILQD